MAVTVEEALFHASHALGSGGQQSPVGGIAILNYAGHFLVNAHSWSWTVRPEVKLDFSSGQDYVWLPHDFIEIVGYDLTSGVASSLSLTTHQHLIDMRTSSITTSTWRYWGAVTTAPVDAKATGTLTADSEPSNAETIILDDGLNPPVTFTFSTTADSTIETGTNREVVLGGTAATTAVLLTDAINDAPLLYFDAVDSSTAAAITLTFRIPGIVGNLGVEANWLTDAGASFTGTAIDEGLDPGEPRYRLDLYPEPVTDESEAITLYYRGRWAEIDDDTAIIPVPDWIGPLYIDAVRAVARGFEMEDEMPMQERLTAIKLGDQYMDAVRTDDNTQYTVGQLAGGAVMSVARQRNPSHLYNFGAVPDQ